MKTRALVLLCVSVITIFTSCVSNTYNPNEILGEQFLEREINLYLKYDCLDSRFQPVHLDLKKGFGILLETSVNDDQIDAMNIYLKEIEGKDRYDLIDAEFYKTTIKKGVKIHEFKITINKGISENENIKVSNLSLLKMMGKGDIIDIHIKSDDPDIQSDIYGGNEQGENGFTNFGQQFCKTIIINP